MARTPQKQVTSRKQLATKRLPAKIARRRHQPPKEGAGKNNLTTTITSS
jgi:hypothetical protein